LSDYLFKKKSFWKLYRRDLSICPLIHPSMRPSERTAPGPLDGSE